MRFTLRLAGFEESVVVDAAQMATLHRPIVARLLAMVPPEGRLLAFVAGVPGGGKTLLGELWTALAPEVGKPCAARALPMDGFHLSRNVLESRRALRDGVAVPLSSLKGAPESFDVDRLAGALAEAARGGRMWWPRYDRTSHETVERGILLDDRRALYLVEGNYLLLDAEGWRGLARFAGARFFVDATREEVRDALLRRHERGGKTPAAARAHFERTDGPNLDAVRRFRLPADVVLGRLAAPPGVAFCVKEASGGWALDLAAAPRA